MKIIQVHNYYQQAGGEDAVVEAERRMLEEHGHVVVPYYKNNEALGSGLWALGRASLQTLWNWETYREFRKLLKAETPDVVHCHNTFPLISPSIYWACTKEGVPVVQTLHNYRLLCLNAFLFRNTKGHENNNLKPKAYGLKPATAGGICELCVSKRFKWPGIKYGCYRGSKAGSLVVALMLLFHKLLGTWSKKVSAYIVLTEFQKKKMIEGGLPADKIWVKPNFIEGGSGLSALDIRGEPGNPITGIDPNVQSPAPNISQNYALFVGRLSSEKGCDVLIKAWSLFREKCFTTEYTKHMEEESPSTNTCPAKPRRSGNNHSSTDNQPQLIVVGDGPERIPLEMLSLSLMPSVQCPVPESITFLGQQPKESVLSLMHNAQFLVLPSAWYEGFPMTIVEAFSCGTPVVASDDGGMRDIIVENSNGLKFAMGDSEQLASKIEWAFNHPEEIKAMGMVAKRAFTENYSAEVNYGILMEIYGQVMRDD